MKPSDNDGPMIKKSHVGRLHANLNVPAGKPIPAALLAKAKKTAGPAVKKQIQFAQNSKGFSHKKPAAKPYSFA